MVTNKDFTFEQYEFARQQIPASAIKGYAKHVWESLTVEHRFDVMENFERHGAWWPDEVDGWDEYVMLREQAGDDPMKNIAPDQWESQTPENRALIMKVLRNRADRIAVRERELALSGWGSW